MTTSKLHQGNYFGKETFNKEYKLICLEYIELFFTPLEINDFLFYNTKLDYSKFNCMIRKTLDNAIYKYLPKYIGNFSKAGISGNIYFGISDNGIIEGVPWYGKLTKKIIKRMINNVFCSNRSKGVQIINDIDVDNDDILDWYFKNLTISIIKLDIDYSKVVDKHIKSMDNLHLIISENEKIEYEWTNYKHSYTDWHSLIFRYSDKLNNFILKSELYYELIDFIKTSIADEDELKTVLDFYSNKSNFDEFISNNDKKVRSLYDNPSNPIIWIIKFKDMKTSYYKHLKPTKPRNNINKNINMIFSKHTPNIIPHLLKNSDVNLYVVIITTPYLKDSYIKYRDCIASEWKSMLRSLLSDGSPTCSYS